MPVIIAKEKSDLWLDPEMKDQETLLDLLKPYPAGDMEAYPVSRRVNSPGYNSPECIKPAGSEG
jgi:putative SOS response-associated peptidase YedK